MVKHLVLAALLVACDSKKPAPAVEAPSTQPAAAALNINLAVVSAGTAKVVDPPPVLILLDGRGNVRVAAVPSWKAVATLDPANGAPVTDVEKLGGSLLVAKDHGETAAQTVERIKTGSDRFLPVAARNGSDDQPSGGTGTAMADTPSTPQSLEPQEQHADATGMLGDLRLFADKTGPGRRALVAGELRDVLKPSTAVVLPDPRVAATRLIDVVAETMAVIGVERDGAVVPLRLEVYRTRGRMSAAEPKVLEVRVRASTLEPDIVAVKQALATRDPWSPIDLLVDHDVNAGRLVETIVQLDQAGARTLGLGAAR